MKTLHLYLIKVLAIFVLALVFISAVIGGLRNICFACYYGTCIWPSSSQKLLFAPSHLTDEIDLKPQSRQSSLGAYVHDDLIAYRFGLIDSEYPIKNISLSNNSIHLIYDPSTSNERYTAKETKGINYFDKIQGLYVYIPTIINEGILQLDTKNILYGGPNNIGPKPTSELGRFTESLYIADRYAPVLIAYDQNERRFLELDFYRRRIRTGPPINNDGRVLQVQYLVKNPGVMQINWIPPETLQWVKQNSWNLHYYGQYANPSPTPEKKILPDGTVMEYRYAPITDIHTDINREPLNTIPVLLDSGKIVKLDRQTLALTDSLGWIPLNKVKENINDSLLAYNIRLFEREGKHHALAVATLDRCARNALFILFDNHGQPVVRQIPKDHPNYSPKNTSEPVFESCNFPNTIDQYPGGPLTVTGQFITESLQVPIIQLGSLYFTETLEPSAIMRTVVWMPDSLLATVILPDNDSNILEAVTATSLTLLPGILLCVFLAWRVVRDGKIIGVCRWGRQCWFWAVILFGLPMYITYRLTRPATVLVTCPACGRGRRPDSDTCHQCGAPWHPAELQIPTWRIIEPA